MFQTVLLSIIRKFSHSSGIYHTGFADSLGAGSGRSILILLANCQQISMTYSITLCTVKIS